MTTRPTIFIALLFIYFNILLLPAQNTGLVNKPPVSTEQLELDSLLKVVRNHYYDKDYKNAIEKGNLLLQLSEEIGSVKNEIAASSLIGNSLLQRGDTIASQKIFEKSLLKAQKANDLEKIIIASIDLGNVYAISKQYEKAIKSYTKVLPLAVEFNQPVYLFLLNYNVGESYLELNLPNQASVFISKTNKYVNGLATAYKASQKSLSGKLSYALGDYKKAAKDFDQGIVYAKESDFKEILLEIYEYYALTEEKKGDYRKANELLKQYNGLNEEKYKLDKIAAVENAVAKFNVEQMEQELITTQYENEIAKERAARNTILISGAIALVFLSILTLFLFRNQSKRKKLLIDLKNNNYLLAVAKEKSDRLRMSKDALFSRISHELRTPMYGIIGISNLMVSDKAEAINSDNIRSLKYSADYLLSLINNVLEMNKINRVKDDLLKKDIINVRQVCDYVMDSARYISQNNANVHQLCIDESIPEKVIGDSSRLSQVLINLLGNAGKFTENGKITLDVTLTSLTDLECFIMFKVKDNGIGIAKDRQLAIFEEAAFIEHHHENEGTGLGLPISKSIIELHNSKLDLISDLGKGTEVRFVLRYELAKEKPLENNILQLNGNLSLLKGKKILVVEDNKINQVVTCKMLENLEIKVDTASDGITAIEKAQTVNYDLILMDINMPPGMDGFETAKKIRAFDENTPIIALTAAEQREVKKRIKDSAMNDYIIKPFKMEYFQSSLLKLMK
ncbi:response regulator [uncultured Nonlabens sp.]|uniref:response regulator n=1 Tax=uncultured Nonlabens sp. TaxID=859306 RepID=UPI0030D9AF38|tara:strand:- start:6511 stop:8721 length:2211 start_codon:yes stop_codon:yes gene_type:complete